MYDFPLSRCVGTTGSTWTCRGSLGARQEYLFWRALLVASSRASRQYLAVRPHGRKRSISPHGPNLRPPGRTNCVRVHGKCVRRQRFHPSTDCSLPWHALTDTKTTIYLSGTLWPTTSTPHAMPCLTSLLLVFLGPWCSRILCLAPVTYRTNEHHYNIKK